MRDFDLTWRAIFALTVSYSAYLAEIFRAGIEAVPKGHRGGGACRSACRAGRPFASSIFPQAIRTVLPPLGNDFVAMIKDSALVSALGVQDITQLGKVYSASTFLFFETYNVVAFLYLVMTLSLSLLVRGLEQRLKRSGSSRQLTGRCIPGRRLDHIAARRRKERNNAGNLHLSRRRPRRRKRSAR